LTERGKSAEIEDETPENIGKYIFGKIYKA
jgi:hypothetical protein